MSIVVYTPSIIHHAEFHTVHVGGSVDRSVLIGQEGKGTGKILWPAAELLSQYIANPSSNAVFAASMASTSPEQSMMTWSWEKCNVLELGSGLGLVTVTLLLLGATVLATDGEQTVVDQLNLNVRLNSDAIIERRGLVMCRGVPYRWGDNVTALTTALAGIHATNLMQCDTSQDPCAWTEMDQSFDVIIASDVVYGADTTIWDLLLDSIVRTAELAKRKILILIAQTQRYKEPEDLFYSRAAQRLALVDTIDISGYATTCIHPGMKSNSKLYIFTSLPPESSL